MWNHLKKLYHQTNKARKFYLDTKLAKCSQGDKTVQEYYNGFLTLWNEKDSMVLSLVPLEFVTHVLDGQQESQINQFLMN